ncbi:hypothetical protein L1887_52036 [Cichorium endivia]|nr:hypothetical protein L1887_52036 [Cichorium endivia]
MAPEPHTPSAEQHGVDDGHWEVALQVIRVVWAATPTPEPLLEMEGKLESINHAPNVAQTSRDTDFGRTRVMVADIFAARMVLRVSCGKEWVSRSRFKDGSGKATPGAGSSSGVEEHHCAPRSGNQLGCLTARLGHIRRVQRG